MQIKPIHKFSSDPSLYSLNDPFHKIQGGGGLETLENN